METLMKIDAALIKQLREAKAWSQEHLAAVSGVSLRTIQRVEAEGTASADTRMALAAALGVSVAELTTRKVSSVEQSWGRTIGLIAGLLGAAAGFYFGWSGALSSGSTGQEAGVELGVMGVLTGATCAAIGILFNRLRQRPG